MAETHAPAPRTALTEQLVISAGGWHPRYTRVLMIERDARTDQDAGLALVLVDGNGDGAELEVEYWQRDEAGLWEAGSSSGHGSLEWLARFTSWSAGPFVCAVGRVGPRQAVQVSYNGRAHRRIASDSGVWGFIHTADSADLTEIPALTGHDSD
jgi:hypothetical protein